VLLALITSPKIAAQDAQLFNNNWYLEYIVIDGNTEVPPDVMSEPEIGRVSFFPNGFGFLYCDAVESNITYNSTQPTFELIGEPIILIGFCADPSNLTFAGLYYTIFYELISPKNIFTYEFESNGEILRLTITNSEGDSAVYNNQLLSSEDFDTSTVSLYPNPTDGPLRINSPFPVDQVKLYNLQGLLVMEQKDSRQLDISGLTAGLYLVELVAGGQRVVRKVVLK